MTHETIEKPPIDRFAVRPNLDDYVRMRREFDYEDVLQELDGLPGGGLNTAYECVDRHVAHGRGGRTAMIWAGTRGEEERYTFEDMKRESDRFANVLAGLGIRKGDRIFFFNDRIPELYFALLGALKRGGIVGPLFSAFGPEPVRDRVEHARARVLVTQPDQLPKVDQIRHGLPDLEYVIVIDKRRAGGWSGDLDYYRLMSEAPTQAEIEPTAAEDWSIMHYTSGTTGKPKGAAHVHKAILGHYATGKYVLDLHPDDIYWCTADPGWVTGTSYGIFAPWSNGVTNVIYEGGFNASHWYALIERYGVTVWYTAPTAIRLLMRAGDAVAARHDLSSVRYAMSVGEPLNPEAVVWSHRVLGFPFHDNWWQTETGSILIANYPALTIKPGSMGLPMPGVTPGIVDDNWEEIPEPDREGNLAIRPGWPSMFRAYWEAEEQYASRFRNGWYITGDRARRDADGYYWFVGRADDVINTAGHLVGPFEVESALIEHPAVAEAGVIGKPDAVAMEIVKAFVSLHAGFTPTAELRREIMNFARKKLGPGVAPREIEFIDRLPKTRSGKIMRRLLKARELGLEAGDTSTLEED